MHSFREIIETISIFDGYNILLVTFIKECRQIQGFISRSEEPEIAYMIKDRLRDRSRVVPGCSTFTGIMQLIDELREYFGQKYTPPVYKDSFLRLRQRKDEGTLDYVSRTRDLHDQTLEAAIDQKAIDH